MKTDLIFIIPICKSTEFVKETLLDLEAYIHRPYHVIFVDDTKNNRFKDFQGERFTTIHSGYESIQKLIWTVQKAFIYALNHFDFDFVVYLDDDATVIGPGFDNWIYFHHGKTDFDCLGVTDEKNMPYRMTMFDEIKTIYKKYNFTKKKVHELQDGVFFAIHIQSRRYVERQREIGVFTDEELKNTKVWVDPYTSYLCELIGLNYVPHGGMADVMKQKAPILACWFTRIDIKPLVENGKFLVLHRTKNMVWDGEVLSEPELRDILKQRREVYLESISNYDVLETI